MSIRPSESHAHGTEPGRAFKQAPAAPPSKDAPRVTAAPDCRSAVRSSQFFYTHCTFRRWTEQEMHGS